MLASHNLYYLELHQCVLWSLPVWKPTKAKKAEKATAAANGAGVTEAILLLLLSSL